jgi:hypothetical protein
MTDKIINFYDKLGLIKNSNLPKTWKKHHIYNNSMILCLGGTGSGKSNALVNYIQRSSGEFYKIIICSFSTTDEPLYKMLEGKNVELINDIEEVPSLSDDFLISGRKFGFTCWLMAQDYASVPKVIVRNINYFILFKINDNISLNNIIRNHNIADVDSAIIKSACNVCTNTPPNFFLIDLKTGNLKERFRMNFLNFLDLDKLTIQ